MPHSINQLRREIKGAFSDRVYPGDSRIAYIAEGDPDYEGSQVGRFFCGKNWQDVSWQSILAESELDSNAFLFFLTVDGFAYYLPAFLHDALDLDLALELAESTCFALCPPSDWGSAASVEMEQKYEQVAQTFTKKENHCIVQVLEYFVAEWQKRGYASDTPDKALQAYRKIVNNGMLKKETSNE